MLNLIPNETDDVDLLKKQSGLSVALRFTINPQISTSCKLIVGLALGG